MREGGEDIEEQEQWGGDYGNMKHITNQLHHKQRLWCLSERIEKENMYEGA